MKTFHLIVAVDQKNGIGKQGKLPWVLSGDMKHFKSITLNTVLEDCVNAIIMGRKTWESLPEKFRPLSNRLNVVLTKNNDYALPADVFKSSKPRKGYRTFEYRKASEKIDQLFIIGGASVYQEAMAHPLCRKIYLTQIQGNFSCDTFFPEFKKTFKQIDCSQSYYEKRLNLFFLCLRADVRFLARE